MAMTVKPYGPAFFDSCVKLFVEAFGAPPWCAQWTEETAGRYLAELAEGPRFAGYTLWSSSNLVGAAFCREKTWWEGDELNVEEFFVHPDFQRMGFGKSLLTALEEHCEARGLKALILLTDRATPAAEFYEKNGFFLSGRMGFYMKALS